MTDAAGELDGGARRRTFAAYAVIALVAVLAYANTLSHGLVYDDKQIVGNPMLAGPLDWKALFTNGWYARIQADVALYRPLANLSYIVNWRANELLFGRGDHELGFHAVNVLLHALASCLAFAWLAGPELARAGLARGVALAAALLFAVLPVHVEVVANVTGRADAMALAFGLAYLLLHRRGWTALAAPAYLLALLSKESAIALLPLAVACDLLAPAGRGGPRRLDRRVVVGWIAAAVTTALWLWLRAVGMRGSGSPVPYVENPLALAPAFERVLTAGWIQVRYLALELAPAGFSSDYSYAEIAHVTSVLDPRFLAFLALVVGAAALAFATRRRAPAIALLVIGYALLFSTTSNLLVAIGTIQAERLAYAPSLCLVALVAAGAWAAIRRLGGSARVVARAALAIAVLVYGAGAVRQNRAWKDELTLFTEQVRTAPRSAKAHLNLAILFAQTKRDREALLEYEQALAIWPEHPQGWYGKANALTRLGDPRGAIEAYCTAIRFGPGNTDARANLALVLIREGRVDEARAVAADLASLDPKHPSLATIAKRLSGR